MGKKLRLDFEHEGKQIWYFEHDNFSLLNRLKLAFTIVTSANVHIKTDGKATRRIGGVEYKYL